MFRMAFPSTAKFKFVTKFDTQTSSSSAKTGDPFVTTG